MAFRGVSYGLLKSHELAITSGHIKTDNFASGQTTQEYHCITGQGHIFPKASDLKQNRAQEKTQFSNTVFGW